MVDHLHAQLPVRHLDVHVAAAGGPGPRGRAEVPRHPLVPRFGRDPGAVVLGQHRAAARQQPQPAFAGGRRERGTQRPAAGRAPRPACGRSRWPTRPGRCVSSVSISPACSSAAPATSGPSPDSCPSASTSRNSSSTPTVSGTSVLYPGAGRANADGKWRNSETRPKFSTSSARLLRVLTGNARWDYVRSLPAAGLPEPCGGSPCDSLRRALLAAATAALAVALASA